MPVYDDILTVEIYCLLFRTSSCAPQVSASDPFLLTRKCTYKYSPATLIIRARILGKFPSEARKVRGQSAYLPRAPEAPFGKWYILVR
jgi:hypothetical protein